MIIRTNDDQRGLVTVGTFDEKKKVFYRSVNSKKHFFKLFNGYALPVDTINTLKGKVKKIQFKEYDTHKVYESDLTTWTKKAIPFKKQLVLPVASFTFIGEYKPSNRKVNK